MPKVNIDFCCNSGTEKLQFNAKGILTNKKICFTTLQEDKYVINFGTVSLKRENSFCIMEVNFIKNEYTWLTYYLNETKKTFKFLVYTEELIKSDDFFRVKYTLEKIERIEIIMHFKEE